MGGSAQLKDVLKKVVENIGWIADLAYELDWKRSLELAEELEERLGIPVYFEENPAKVYPALVVNTRIIGGEDRVIAWLDIDEDNRVTIREEGGDVVIEPRRFLNLLKQ